MASHAMSLPQNSTQRKPVIRECVANKRVAVHCRATRQQVVDDAIELLTAGDTREISAVLASRHRMTERQVDRYITAALASVQRAYTNLELGVVNAVSMAREAAEDTEAEVFG